jgi:hypothetical protein
MKNKKNRYQNPQKNLSRVPAPAPAMVAKPSFTLSRVGKKLLIAGIVLACLGYYVLTLADPFGQNWAANLSPFLILVGYALVGLSILARDPQTPQKSG